jgi:hypothetical protein
VVGDQNIDAAKMLRGFRDEFAGGIGRVEIAADGVAVFLAAFFCQSFRL